MNDVNVPDISTSTLSESKRIVTFSSSKLKNISSEISSIFIFIIFEERLSRT